MKTVYHEDQAIFLDDNRTIIQAMVTEESEKGNAVHKRIIEVTPSPVFDEFVQQVSLEQVEENTKKFVEQVKENENSLIREAADLVKREMKKQDIIATDAPKQSSFDPNNISTEDLFKLKLQSFEIEEVKTSKNRELKAKIRKGNSFMEVVAFTAATILDSQGLVHKHDD